MRRMEPLIAFKVVPIWLYMNTSKVEWPIIDPPLPGEGEEITGEEEQGQMKTGSSAQRRHE